MLCFGAKRSSGTRNHFKKERAWERVTIAHAQIKNYTASTEPPFLFCLVIKGGSARRVQISSLTNVMHTAHRRTYTEDLQSLELYFSQNTK